MDENEQILRKHFEDQTKNLTLSQFASMVSGDMVVIRSNQTEMRDDIVIIKDELHEIKSLHFSKDAWIIGLGCGLIGLITIIVSLLLYIRQLTPVSKRGSGKNK